MNLACALERGGIFYFLRFRFSRFGAGGEDNDIGIPDFFAYSIASAIPFRVYGNFFLPTLGMTGSFLERPLLSAERIQVLHHLLSPLSVAADQRNQHRVQQALEGVHT